LIASDALICESGEAARSKAGYAAHHLPVDAAFAGATKRTVTQRPGHASSDLAWIATESTTTGTYEDRAIKSMSTQTMLLRRENGAWRIAHIHWSSANEKYRQARRSGLPLKCVKDRAVGPVITVTARRQVKQRMPHFFERLSLAVQFGSALGRQSLHIG